MRDIALVSAILVVLAIALVHPFAGVIVWTWFSLESPHQEAFSFSRELPLNFVIALVTIAAWLFSKERKLPPNQFLVWAICIFLAWTTFNSFFAVAPEWSWPFWDRTWKTFALGILIATLATNQTRIHAIVWTAVISLFYFGAKGGVFTLLTGGSYKVFGPENTIIGDNNQLAVGLLMTLPLANYLRVQSANRYVRWGLVAGMALTLVAVVGSYSRGAFLGLAALAGCGLLLTRRKFAYAAVAATAAYFIVTFMPQSFWDRMNTIGSAGNDTSFLGRVSAWQVSFFYARDHFPFGAGFYAPQLASVFHTYFPQQEPHAAHSIFFQVLGEHGFMGLALYLAILIGAFIKCFAIRRVTRGDPELLWLNNLATTIGISLIVFCVAGSALSMAYYDGFVVCLGLLVPMTVISAQPREVPLPTVAPAAA